MFLGVSKLIRKLTFIIFLLPIVLTIDVEASRLDKGWYWTYQTIDTVSESVKLKDNILFVEIFARIQIDYKIFNETDWITFTYSPILYTSDQIESFESSVDLQTSSWGGGSPYTTNKEAVYTVNGNNSLGYTYNVSLKSLKENSAVIFKVKYAIKNRIFRERDYTYGFFYQSKIDTLNHDIYFSFPSHLEFTREGCKLNEGATIQDCSVAGKDVSATINFIYIDKNEKKEIEAKQKKEDRIFDLILGLSLIFVGILITLLFENIFYKNRKLFGNIKLKIFKTFQKIQIQIFKK